MKRLSYYGTIFSPFTVLRPLAMLASPPTPTYPARVDLFVGLMRKRVRFHSVEVLVEPDGRFFIVDGHHRTAASLQCGYTHLPTLLYASQERTRLRCRGAVFVATKKNLDRTSARGIRKFA